MEEIFQTIEQKLIGSGFEIKSMDTNRPWGSFFVIAEQQTQKFADEFFMGLNVDTLKISGQLSPKILLVKPGKRLSWQYHFRRAEVWRIIEGEAGVSRSFTDKEGETEILKTGTQITLKQGERHRLIGLDNWAVIAEIWQHTDIDNPSNEEDIVRLQDDFGR